MEQPSILRHCAWLTALISLGVWAAGALSPKCCAFDIVSVNVLPETLEPTSLIQFDVFFRTPSHPAFLTQSSEFSIINNSITIDIYAGSGISQALSDFHEIIPVGVLPAGTYDYTVNLHPDHAVGWGRRTVTGSLTVPEPRRVILLLLPLLFLTRFKSPRRKALMA